METQKVKNKNIIGFIYGMLKVLVSAGAITLLISMVFFLITLSNPGFEPF